MQYLQIDTHLAITPEILHDISRHLEQGSTNWNFPYVWEIIGSSEYTWIIKELEEELEEVGSDRDRWESQHDDMTRECKKLEDKYDDLESKYNSLLESYAK